MNLNIIRPGGFNIGSSDNDGKKIIIIVAVIATVLVFTGYAIYKFMLSDEKGGKGGVVGNKQTEQQKIAQDMKRSIKQRSDIFGYVRGVQTAPDKKVVILEVEASLVDVDKLNDESFMAGRSDMENFKKTFRVTVDESTKLNVENKTDISAGSFVTVYAPMSVYEYDTFTATEVSVQKNTPGQQDQSVQLPPPPPPVEPVQLIQPGQSAQ